MSPKNLKNISNFEGWDLTLTVYKKISVVIFFHFRNWFLQSYFVMVILTVQYYWFTETAFRGKSKMMMKCPVFQRKKGMLHVDPAWSSFALLSSNLLIEILYKWALFNFFTSLILLHNYPTFFNPALSCLAPNCLALFCTNTLLPCDFLTTYLHRHAFSFALMSLSAYFLICISVTLILT